METDTLGKKAVAELLKDAPPLLGDVLSTAIAGEILRQEIHGDGERRLL